MNALVRGLEKNGGTLKLGTHVEQVSSNIWLCGVSNIAMLTNVLGIVIGDYPLCMWSRTKTHVTKTPAQRAAPEMYPGTV